MFDSPLDLFHTEDSSSALSPSQRMRIAYLLTMVGGFLDAYTYFERGGVFANAQTGNIVKLGIALSNGARDAYLAYLMPICVFSLGILTALTIKEILTRRELRLIRRSVLAVEMVCLAIVGLIPLGERWDIFANCLVSFAAAMQYETFTTFRGEAIVTTMSTGNLRKCVDSLFEGIVRHDPAKLARAGLFLSIILVFASGAFVGTRACQLMGRAAVVPVILALGVAIAIITVLRKRNIHR
jgi:uncharacterized membrane protein YoaK (UPF0700 family)